MIKVTFVYPDFENLGIQYLMGICLKNGYAVDFVYYEAQNNFLNKVNTSLSYSEIAGRIVDTDPSIVAFSCVTDNYRYQLNCAKALRQKKPGLITIFGGIHPTAVPKKVLKNDAVDCVAIGESEISFSHFLKAGLRDDAFILPDDPVEGIIFKKDGKYIGECREGGLSDLNDLPFPHKEPFRASMKMTGDYRIITSRGCPYSCSYCFNSFYHGLRGKKDLRRRSVENVIDELLIAKKETSPKYISFWDDSFTTSKKWIREFCSVYKEKIGLPFMCAVNPFFLDGEIAELLNDAGCIYVSLGVQSTSEELCLNVLNRRSNNAKIAETIQNLKAQGILVQIDHMLGIPGDTPQKQEENLLFYNECKPNLISVYWLTYYPKTAIIETARKQGILSDDDVESIEEGEFIKEGSLLTGGSLKDSRPYYSAYLMLNYLPILPRWLVRLLVSSHIYRLFSIRNYYITTVIPRVITSLTKKHYYHGRSYIMSYFNDMIFNRFKGIKKGRTV